MSFRSFARCYAQVAWVLVSSLWLTAGSADAMTVAPPTLPELVNTAGSIVRAEVLETRAAWDEVNGHKVIHTFVTCRVAKRLKGADEQTIVLRFLGGRVGDAQMKVDDMPELGVGAEYYLFLKADTQRGSFCPLVAVMHGAYKINRDSASGRERLERMDGTLLESISDVGRTHGAAPQAQSASGAATTDQFEQAILSELNHATTR